MTALILNNSAYLTPKITETNTTVIDTFILAASSAIEKHCHRKFVSATYDEICRPGLEGTIFLNAFPVTNILRVFSNKIGVMTFTYTSGTAVSANFNTTSTGLNLTATDAGVTTTTNLLFATYATLTALTTAATAVTNWDATLSGDYGDYPSTDIVAGQWGSGASASLQAWVEDSNRSFAVDQKTGIITGQFGTPRGDSGLIGYRPIWQGSYQESQSSYSPEVRVKYVGGFTTVPEDIQQVTANLVANMLDGKTGNIVQENLGDYSYTLATGNIDSMPLKDKKILNFYRDRIV